MSCRLRLLCSEHLGNAVFVDHDAWCRGEQTRAKKGPLSSKRRKHTQSQASRRWSTSFVFLSLSRNNRHCSNVTDCCPRTRAITRLCSNFRDWPISRSIVSSRSERSTAAYTAIIDTISQIYPTAKFRARSATSLAEPGQYT